MMSKSLPIKAITITIILGIILSACVSRGELDKANQVADGLQTQVSELQTQLADKDKEITGYETSLSEKETRVNELTARVSELETLLSENEQQLQTLTQERDELSKKLGDTEADLKTKSYEARSLQTQVDKLVCSKKLTNMRYKDVFDSSNILMVWYGSQSGVKKTTGSYRDKIWSNALTGIHGIRFISSDDNKPYVEHFLVYFDEFRWKPGVFWIGEQCWLDVP